MLGDADAPNKSKAGAALGEPPRPFIFDLVITSRICFSQQPFYYCAELSIIRLGAPLNKVDTP